MDSAQGQSEKVLLGIENGFKTMPGTVNAAKLPITNPAAKIDASRFTSNALTGVPRARPVVYGKNKLGGSLEVECSVDSLSVPIYGTMGGLDEWGTAGNESHRFNMAAMKPLFMEQQFNDIGKMILFNGILLSKAAFKYAMEGLMTAVFDVMGAKQSAPYSSTVVTGTQRDDTGQPPFDYLTGVIKLGGTTVGYFKTISVTIDRGVELGGAIDGSRDMATYASKVPTISGSIEAYFIDEVLLDAAVNSTESSLELVLTDSNTLGWGKRVVMPTVKLRPTTPVTQGQTFVMVNCDFDAYARGTASNYAALSGTKGFTTLTFTLGVNDTLTIAFSAGGTQSFTLPAGSKTPTQINTALSAITNGTTFVENGRVMFKEAVAGSGGAITFGGNAATTLGLSTSILHGVDNVDILIELYNGQTTVAP